MARASTHLSIQFALFIVIIVLFSACEDIVEIDTPSEPPRLIVDALARVNVNEPFFGVEVKVSQTSSFFNEK